jgi:hypothetical protein
MVGNPPFLGGKRISGAAGSDFREFLVRWLASGAKGSADLVTYFFLRATQVTDEFGFLATNTISQGDTREVGLDRITADGWTIHRAVKSTPWPGQATLEIAKVWLRKQWHGAQFLGETRVASITPALDPGSRVAGQPKRLVAAGKVAFQGSVVVGLGFTMEPKMASQLIEDDPRNREVLFPYLNGEDVNSKPNHEASRWVINFFDWSIERAAQYPACFAIVEEKVKPVRLRVNRKAHRDYWWHYGDKRPALYEAIRGFTRVLVIARISKTVQPVFVRTGQVLNEKTVVFAYDDDFHFGVLSSAVHWWWAVTHSSTLRTDTQYTPTDCFETFPQPSYSPRVEEAGRALDERRAALMIRTDEGLTKTYNRVHNPDDSSPGIQELRDLHVALDVAVRDAYGWSDLDLDHRFRDTPQGRRFTLGPSAHTEVLDRLLELNHRCYAEEVAAGLHDKKRQGRPKRRKPVVDEPRLL